MTNPPTRAEDGNAKAAPKDGDNAAEAVYTEGGAVEAARDYVHAAYGTHNLPVDRGGCCLIGRYYRECPHVGDALDAYAEAIRAEALREIPPKEEE